MPGSETPLHVYLSPHLDDAVLSCAGRMWRQAQAGERVVVVTVFGGAPPSGTFLSPFARELHVRWGQPAEAVRRRRAEDVQALTLLGAEPVYWPYPDCIYRRTPEGDYLYPDEEALWGEIHASDRPMIRELTRRMRALPLAFGNRLYAPLAVGRHVDHRIVRQSAEACGRSLTYYEDFPYARDPGALGAALSHDGWEPELVALSERALEAKAAAIACYGSQISTFWAGPDQMAASVRAFAEQSGSGVPAERYWRPERGT